MYNFKKFPGVTPPDPQHWLGGEGVKPPSGEILATGLFLSELNGLAADVSSTLTQP